MKQSHESDDKKLKVELKKFNCQPLPDIDEVNFFKNDGSIIHFKKPKGKVMAYFLSFF